MSHEKILLLNLLKDYCNNNSQKYDLKTVDLDSLLKLSNEQSLSSIVFTNLKRQLPINNASFKFRRAFLTDVFLSVNRADMLNEFTGYMEKRKIPFICMKGSVFREYYPIPSVRSMGDVDIIIRPEDKEAVDDIFTDLMHFSRYVDNHSVWTYYLKDFQFEVHNHMFYEELANDFDYIGYFDHIFEYVHHDQVFGIQSDCLYVPDENYHFLYLMTHTAKHIINNGSGFRAYLDMVMFTRNNDHLDWEWLQKELEKMKLLQFTETCFALCEKWFDVKMPLSHKELDENFYKEITDKTFNDGIFGLGNSANEGAHAAKEIKRDDKGYWFTAIRLTVHLLFPPYRDMILTPWYSFLRGRPCLLPVAWIYRWVYCIVHKFRYSLGRLTEPFTKKKKIKERESYIKDWGL